MISIIIPVLNEELTIGKLLMQLSKVRSSETEVIVVDGGSLDNTIKMAHQFEGIHILSAPKGRALQMNAGAREAKGDKLFFLHADSIPSEELIQNLTQIDVPAATFKLKFNRTNWLLSFYAWFTKFNFSILTYGDQGLLIDKQLFEKVGGYRKIPLLEDLDIIRRLNKEVKVKKYPFEVITSSRRFDKHGVVWQQMKNILIVFGYYLGLSPHFLARFYKY
ncbi:MAG: TIGR04283 family arsenosugar biosynthesis glycosyltransferase [Fulvivirga sp.]|uniref:TIGR04283 family arsenosugar biosynthesis glycosyltransferase n=1 Tax=Fulvivirga sp. TaxID=1931237 RepID=UPI0032EA9309